MRKLRGGDEDLGRRAVDVEEAMAAAQENKVFNMRYSRSDEAPAACGSEPFPPDEIQ